jgi:hypothetical protein
LEKPINLRVALPHRFGNPRAFRRKNVPKHGEARPCECEQLSNRKLLVFQTFVVRAGYFKDRFKS